MIVNYKHAGAWVIQYGKMVGAPKDAEGKSIQEKVFQGGTVLIKPGTNSIIDKNWLMIKDNPDVVSRLKSGELQIIEDVSKSGAIKSDSGNDRIESLEKYDQKIAVDIVDGTMDSESLTRWKKKEKRPAVLKAIKDQSEKIKNADEAFGKGE